MQDEDRVCGHCGTPVDLSGTTSNTGYTNTIPTQTINTGYTSNNNNNGQSSNAKIGKIVVLSVVALLGLLLLFGVYKIVNSNTGVNGVLNKYCKALKEEDIELLESITSPLYEDYVEDYYRTGLYDVLDYYIINKLDTYEEKVGSISKIDYSITKSKDLRDTVVEKIIEYYEDKYNSDASDVKGVKEVNVKLSVKGSDKNATFNETLYLVKHNGTWKLYYDTIKY